MAVIVLSICDMSIGGLAKYEMSWQNMKMHTLHLDEAVRNTLTILYHENKYWRLGKIQ